MATTGRACSASIILRSKFGKVSGGLLLRLERPGDATQGLLGDRAKDGSNAAFEMEMDRGRADSQRLGELAQAEPICADALDQLAAAATIAALVRPARVPAFRFSLTIGLQVFFLGILMMATMTLVMSRERGAPSESVDLCIIVDGGENPRLSGGAPKTGTNFAANSWRPECGAIDPCQRRKPPEAVAKGQRLQGSIAR